MARVEGRPEGGESLLEKAGNLFLKVLGIAALIGLVSLSLDRVVIPGLEKLIGKKGIKPPE